MDVVDVADASADAARSAEPPGPMVRVLGPVAVTVGSREAGLSVLERGLLAVLAAAAGTTVSVDRLVAALWGDPPPRSARNRVQALVSSLRRTAGTGSAFIETRAPGYRLARDPASVDVARFDELVARGDRLAAAGRPVDAAAALRAALTLWRGDPFDGADTGRDAGVLAEGLRLRESRLSTVECAVAAELDAGGHAAMVPELTALVAANPTRERLRAQLMLALHRDGRSAEASAVYREGYSVLREQLGAEPGPRLQAAHRTVLGGEAAPARRATQVHRSETRPETRTGPRTDPQQRGPLTLPPDLPDLSGRTAELARAEHLLAGRPVAAVLVVSGMGGVGKSVLAVRIAYRVAHRYPDGVLHVDLRGTEAVARTSAQVMRSVLVASGTAATDVPQDGDALLLAYRSHLGNRRILLVLDNASEEAQVRPLLLSSPGSAVVVTSRKLLAGLDAAHHVPLDVFPPADARHLLALLVGADRVHAEPDAADRVLEHCGRLPLAVRVIGVRLALQTELTLSRMAERLADEDARLDELSAGDRGVRASLGVAYRRLDPDTATMLCAVGLFPAPEFPLWMAAAAAQCPPAAAEAALARLAEMSLVGVAYHAGEGRYRVHDLIRAFGRERAAADIQKRTHGLRVAYETLAALAHRADAALPSAVVPVPAADPAWPAPPPDAIDRAGGPAGWFDAEHALLVGAVRDCLRREWHDLAWRLLISMTLGVGNRGDIDEWWGLVDQVLSDQALGAPNRGPDPRAWPLLALALGGTLRGHGHTARAVVLLRAARIRLQRLGDDVEAAAVAAGQLGMAARALGRHRVARAAFAWALRRLDPVASAHHVAQIEIGVGNLALDGGDRRAARDAYEQSLATVASRPNPSVEANAHVCLGLVAARDGRHGAAAEHYGKALALFTAAGDRANAGRAELGLADTQAHLGNLPGAGRSVARALLTVRDVGDLVGHAQALVVSGRLRMLEGDQAAAVAALHEAIDRLGPTGHAATRGAALVDLATAHHACGEPGAARRAAAAARDAFAAIAVPEPPAVAELLGKLRRMPTTGKGH